MRTPSLRATMQRRILINYRVDPDVLAKWLPAPFRPALVRGQAVAGICLIRLGNIRPAGLPAVAGLTTENAAHRVAVCWDTPGGVVTGVYVPRRDTSSRLAALAGGRVFPGYQHRARFDVEESDGQYRLRIDSRDGSLTLGIECQASDRLMTGSVFGGIEEASAFFRCAPVGYAATPTPGRFDGVALGTDGWQLTPLQVGSARSSWFDDQHRFPAGSAILDSALLMADLETTWRPLPALLAGGPARIPAGARPACGA